MLGQPRLGVRIDFCRWHVRCGAGWLRTWLLMHQVKQGTVRRVPDMGAATTDHSALGSTSTALYDWHLASSLFYQGKVVNLITQHPILIILHSLATQKAFGHFVCEQREFYVLHTSSIWGKPWYYMAITWLQDCVSTHFPGYSWHWTRNHTYHVFYLVIARCWALIDSTNNNHHFISKKLT